MTDLRRIRAIVDKTERVLTYEEGSLVATYARTLSSVARDRRRDRKGDDLREKGMEELLEMARGIPELRDALGANR